MLGGTTHPVIVVKQKYKDPNMITIIPHSLDSLG